MPTLDLTLYLATDPAFLARPDGEDRLAAVLAAGVTALQYRDKQAGGRAFYETGRRLLALARRAGVPLIVNDRIDVALALGADGVHLGRGDLPPAAARRLAPGLIVGCSANTAQHLADAVAAGADYAGVGPVFPTTSKGDTAPLLGLEGLRRLLAGARLPCVAIGGITAATAPDVLQAGAAGVCVIGAVQGAPEPVEAARALRRALDQARLDAGSAPGP